jgi:hypothetical protein
MWGWKKKKEKKFGNTDIILYYNLKKHIAF